METLTQEAFILIYPKPDTLGATGTGLTGTRVIPTTTPPNTVQPVITNAATHKSYASASSCLDLEELLAEMTIRDSVTEKETESRSVRPVQQTYQLPAAGRP